MDFRLELVQVPVSDVDRAKAFYTEKAGFNADHDHQVSDEIRFVQLTPPGSPTSIAIGSGMSGRRRPGPPRVSSSSSPTSRPRGRSSPRAEWTSATSSRSPGARFVFFSDPDGNGWAVQEIPAPSSPRSG